MGSSKRHRAAMGGVAFSGIVLVVFLLLVFCRGRSSPDVPDRIPVPAPIGGNVDGVAPSQEMSPSVNEDSEQQAVPPPGESNEAGADVRVRMRTADGRPIATSIHVSALGKSRSLVEFLYDEEAPGYAGEEAAFNFRVRAGPQRLFFVPYDDPTLAITYVDIDVTEGASNEVTVVFLPGYCVAGQLVDVTGRPVAGRWIRATFPVKDLGRRKRNPLPDARTRGCEVTFYRNEVSLKTETDPEGRFRFESLPTATVKLEWRVGKVLDNAEQWASGESNRLVVPEVVEPPEPLPFEKDSERD